MSGRIAQGPAVCLHQRRPQNARLALQVQTVRQGRRVGERVAAALHRNRGRGRDHQVGVDRPVQSRPGRVVHLRRLTLDALDKLDELEAKQFGDPETLTRIAQYELAYRMQISVPEVFDIAKEPKRVHEMYGTRPGEANFANNCLLARRLVEKGVR